MATAPTIFTFLKILEREEHATQLLKGSLRMHSVRYFKDYKDANGEVRGDTYEGVTAILQASKTGEVQVGSVRIPGTDLAGPIIVHREDHLDWRVFCLYALGSNAVDEGATFATLEELTRALQPDEQCAALGEYFVVFRRPQVFLDRVRAALSKLDVSYRFALVEYYDETTFHGSFDDADVPFRKRRAYKSQREYRIAFEPQANDEGVFVLEVGDLSDVAVVMTRHRFLATFEVQLKEQTTDPDDAS